METIQGKIYKIYSPVDNEIGSVLNYSFSLKRSNGGFITCYGSCWELFESLNVKLTGSTKKSASGKEYFQFTSVEVNFDNIQKEDGFLKKVLGSSNFQKLRMFCSNEQIIIFLKNGDKEHIASYLGVKEDSKRIKKIFDFINKNLR